MMYLAVFLLAAVAEMLGFWAGYRFHKGGEDDKRLKVLQELDRELDRCMELEMRMGRPGPEMRNPEWFEGAVWMYERLFYDG